MAITTRDGHVSRAKDFFNKSGIFFSLGKTESWESLGIEGVDEYNPPKPEPTDKLVELLGYKQVNSKYLVVPSEDGELSYRESKWKIVPYEDAISQGARWVYLSAYIQYSEFPTNVSYRQIGVNTDLELAEGVQPGKSNLLPHEVSDSGILEVIDNRTPVFREPDQRELIIMIIEF